LQMQAHDSQNQMASHLDKASQDFNTRLAEQNHQLKGL
jgi:hypothetical protein